MKKVIHRVALLFFISILDATQFAVAHDVAHSRLTADNQDPLYYVVMVGSPQGEYAAFLSVEDKRCVVSVRRLVDNEVVASLSDHLNCRQEQNEAEDASSVNLAKHFSAFMKSHGETLKQLLARFDVNHARYQFPDGSSKRNYDEKGRTCIQVNRALICAGADLVVKPAPQ